MKAPERNSICNKINKALGKIQNYQSFIPLDEIFSACTSNGFQPVDESGQDWSGFFCGENGSAHIALVEVENRTPVLNRRLIVTWWKMDSRQSYDFTAYIS